jgi:hypothetical protein
MRKVSLIAAAALLVAAGYLASGVQADAAQACKAQKSMDACKAIQGCAWDAAKNHCQKAPGSKKTK